MRSCALLAALCVIAAVARPAVSAPVFGAEAFASLNTFAMEDVNAVLTLANVNTGSDFDDIYASLGGGLGARAWLNDHLMVEATWEPLLATSESEVPGASGKLDVGGNSFQVSGGYLFPASLKSKLGFGAGVGWYVLNGDGDGTELTGSTLGFHFMGLGEWTVTGSLAATAAVGYRLARIDEIEEDGVKRPLETDYSGVLARVGLAYYFGERK